MIDTQSLLDKRIYVGLKALADSAFPKICPDCGRRYVSAEAFIGDTESKGASGLQEARDEEGYVVVELHRYCQCGAVLLDFFNDRRDLSDVGLKRRQRFGELLDYVVERGVERNLARQELIKVLHGHPSEILKKITPPK
jgi:hypothetical protein